MIETSNEIKHISAALLKFQGAVDGVGKSSANQHFKSRYANLETVVDTARPELQAVGIVFMQSGGAIVDGVMAMTTRLTHADSGEWIQGTMDICLGKRDPQGVGSAQTYAQRYHLMAMLGLPPVDDDGEAAMDRNNTRPEPSQAPTLPKAKSRDLYSEMQAEIDACASLEDLATLWKSRAFQAEFEKLPNDWKEHLTERKDLLKAELSAAPAKPRVAPNFEGMPA
jgi:hypothetical protein